MTGLHPVLFRIVELAVFRLLVPFLKEGLNNLFSHCLRQTIEHSCRHIIVLLGTPESHDVLGQRFFDRRLWQTEIDDAGQICIHLNICRIDTESGQDVIEINVMTFEVIHDIVHCSQHSQLQEMFVVFELALLEGGRIKKAEDLAVLVKYIDVTGAIRTKNITQDFCKCSAGCRIVFLFHSLVETIIHEFHDRLGLSHDVIQLRRNVRTLNFIVEGPCFLLLTQQCLNITFFTEHRLECVRFI